MADDLRDRMAQALIARIKQSVLVDDPFGPGRIGQPFAATEYDLADAVLAVRDDELAALRAQVKGLTLARNGANAMRGVHKRRADRLRTELDHAKAALAGDNEAIRLFMADHEAKVQRLREQRDMWQREAEQAEDAVARLDARHQPKRTGRWVSCVSHTHETPDPGCPRCAGSPIWGCVRSGCGSWPCSDHLALHDETPDTCVHVPALDVPADGEQTPTPATEETDHG